MNESVSLLGILLWNIKHCVVQYNGPSPGLCFPKTNNKSRKAYMKYSSVLRSYQYTRHYTIHKKGFFMELSAQWKKSRLHKYKSLQCLNIERFKKLFISQLWWFRYNKHCEESRPRKGQGIINSHASTLSAWAQRLPIKPSRWQSWLLQNTISYRFSILGQRTRATGRWV